MTINSDGSNSQAKTNTERSEEVLGDTSRRLKVSTLSALDDETVSRLAEKREEARAKISRQFAEEAIKEGIYEEDGITYWVCPSAFFKEDNYIGMMLSEFATLSGAQIRTISANPELTSAYSEQFLLGLWFGIFSSTNQRRSRGKKEYELGRTCVFSLIVKNVFLSTEELGIKALEHDNYFFGNNPGESYKKDKSPFYLKMKLRSFFVEPRWGEFLFGVINKTALAVGFTYLTEAEQDKVIEYNIKPLDKLITSLYPVTDVLNKKGHKVGEEIKRPKLIRSSPLYKKYEIDIIHRALVPLFSDLTDLNSQYKEFVLSESFSSVEKRIASSIKIRRDVLARFANRTKLRLQDIRKYAQDPTIRKAKVTPIHLDLLLTNTTDPAKSLVADIIYILGAVGSYTGLLSIAFGKRIASSRDAHAFLYKTAAEAYLKELPRDHEFVNAVRPQSTVADPIQEDHEAAIKAFMKLPNCIGQLKNNALGIRKIKTFKLFGRADQLRLNAASIVHVIRDLVARDEYSSDLAAMLVSDGKFSNSRSALTHYREKTKKELEYVLVALGLTVQECKEDAAKKVASEAIKSIEASLVELAAIQINRAQE